MFPRPTSWGVLFCAFFGFTSAVNADVILSKSNPPTLEISDTIGAAFEAERRAVNRINANRARRILDTQSDAAVPSGYYDRDRIRALPVVAGDREWGCLTEALYFEARGESVRGMFAVAEVILNRVDSERYPSTICAVVNQGTGERFRCQFTYTCDGRAETINEPKAWDFVGKVAALSIARDNRPLTDGATHYHTTAVNPRWARVYDRVGQIGDHLFYRQNYDRVARR
ncbi:MAG: cell wall hydrolase [Pseudomonadota bacterium]